MVKNELTAALANEELVFFVVSSLYIAPLLIDFLFFIDLAFWMLCIDFPVLITICDKICQIPGFCFNHLPNIGCLDVALGTIQLVVETFPFKELTC